MELCLCDITFRAMNLLISLGPRPNGRSYGWITSSGDVIHPQLRPLGLGPRLPIDLNIFHEISAMKYISITTP